MDLFPERTLRRPFIWIALIVGSICLTLGFIFGNSLQPASDSTTESLVMVDLLAAPIRSVAKIFSVTLTDDALLIIVRKGAHLFEFFVLGLELSCLQHVLRLSGRCCATWINPLFFTLLCAVADEFIQTLVPGRCGTVVDVLIDFTGGLIGILLAQLLIHHHHGIQNTSLCDSEHAPPCHPERPPMSS